MEGAGDQATAEGMELLRKEVEKLKGELKTSEDGECDSAPREMRTLFFFFLTDELLSHLMIKLANMSQWTNETVPSRTSS